MTKTRALPQRARYLLTCVLSTALAACGSDSAKSVAPLAPPPAQALQAAAYDCAVDQSQLPVLECQALVALYASTNGASWTTSTGWLQNASPCSWYGISCNGGFVWTIGLAGNNLTGVQIGRASCRERV